MQATVYRATWWVGDELVTFLWKSLSWKEYRKVAGLRPDDFATYAAVYRAAVIAGLSLEHVPAGIVQWIARYELENNPFGGQLKPIQQQRQRSTDWCGSYLNASRALVAWAFGYKFEEIDEWDSTTFFNRLAQAEYVFGKPFEPEDPNAPPPVDKQGSRKLRRMKP